MKVTKLEIRRQESYESNAGQLNGIVTLQDENGQQVITLSPGSISAIFSVIREQVIARAKHNAAQTSIAMQAATDEPLMIAQADNLLSKD